MEPVDFSFNFASKSTLERGATQLDSTAVLIGQSSIAGSKININSSEIMS